MSGFPQLRLVGPWRLCICFCSPLRNPHLKPTKGDESHKWPHINHNRCHSQNNPYLCCGMPARGQSDQRNPTLMVFTKLAVLLATSLADWTKCLLAAGLVVLEEASLQALHSADVCLATMVAAERTCPIINTV